MKITEERIEEKMFESPVFSEYFGGMKIVVADIETTGLSYRNCAVILGGVVMPDGDGRLAVQFFADSVDDENELLERYVGLLSESDVIVTYNGQKFDIPFLRNRMKNHGLDTSGLDRLYSFDMYRVLRKYSHLPKLLPNMKQKTVEAYLGDAGDRKDEIDGAQSVELYYEYCSSTGKNKSSILDRILLHNRDDIVRLADMMRIIRTLDLHEIMFRSGFPVCAGENLIQIESIKIKNNKIYVSGHVFDEVSDYISFDRNWHLQVKSAEQSLALEIECERIEHFLVADLKQMNMDVPAVQELAGYESGYLILHDGEHEMYREINQLVRNFLCMILQ